MTIKSDFKRQVSRYAKFDQEAIKKKIGTELNQILADKGLGEFSVKHDSAGVMLVSGDRQLLLNAAVIDLIFTRGDGSAELLLGFEYYSAQV